MSMEKLRSFTRSIWTQITAGAIALAGMVWSIFSDRFKAKLGPAVDWSLDRPAALWRWLVSWHSLPGWVLVIGFLATLVIVLMIREHFKAVSDSPHLKYTTDIFEGIRWRWDWDRLEDFLNPFCVQCDQVMVPTYSDIEPWIMILECENCRNRVRVAHPCEQLPNRVRRAIDRKRRTGEWRATLPN
jgi:hypothetical protein